MLYEALQALLQGTHLSLTIPEYNTLPGQTPADKISVPYPKGASANGVLAHNIRPNQTLIPLSYRLRTCGIGSSGPAISELSKSIP